MAASRLETRPRTYRVTLAALLSFPFRLCNPPPAVGKVRSFGGKYFLKFASINRVDISKVTPLLKVRLEDILDRKHLPPLEYTVKYHQWAAATKARKHTGGYLQEQGPAPTASHLSMFYARAKQTFFMPNSVYELDIPSDILAPFHTTDLPHHPDPSVFHQVSQEVTKMLQESLARFLNAQLSNVGNNRVLCGIIAGTFCILVGALPPLVLNFTQGQSRWERLAALPALWIGLSILITAINGICVGVYIFGDLRQLRTFELERPPISKPRLLGKASLPMFAPPPPPPNEPVSPVPLVPPPPMTISPPSPPPPAYLPENHLSRTPTMSSTSSASSSCSGSSDSSYESSHLRIEISGAYYDTESVDDDPYYSPSGFETNFAINEKTVDDEESVFAITAGFIHPYDSTIDLEPGDSPKFLPQERQPISPFNFDALPPRPQSGYSRQNEKMKVEPPAETHEIVEITSDLPPLSKVSAATILERLQLRCIPKRWLLVETPTPAAADPKDSETQPTSFGPGVSRPKAAVVTRRRPEGAMSIRKQFKKVKAVPAFASFTRILSPVVVRGHWDIVVRSLAIAFVLTWVVIICIVAVPVIR
ncbi:hypothetical protein H0H92_015377 [Tricholoma furcatifolium]|nr:hypothetical protein H0H92_015377 [Tricholoma furcatifolium]